MKNLFTNIRIYHKETMSSGDIIDKNTILKAYPKLKTLKLPPEQLEARINALAKIDDFIKNNNSYKMNMSLSSLSMEPERDVIRQMITLKTFLQEPYNASKWGGLIHTYLDNIDGKNVNYTRLFKTSMTNNMFLAKIV